MTKDRSKSGDTPFNKTSSPLFIAHKIKGSRNLFCDIFLTQKCRYVSFDTLDIFIYSIQHTSCGASLLEAQSQNFDL